MKCCNVSTLPHGEQPAEFATPTNVTRSMSQDYLDALLIRLAPNTDNWYRNHFPVIMETNMSHYFNEKIYNEINYEEWTFPTIEYAMAPSGGGGGTQPFSSTDKVRNLNHIFNQDQTQLIESKLGKSIYFTHMFTEMAKARKADENFEQLLELDDPYFKQINSEFKNRLNRLYTHHLLGDLLDSGEIDYAVLNILEQI